MSVETLKNRIILPIDSEWMYSCHVEMCLNSRGCARARRGTIWGNVANIAARVVNVTAHIARVAACVREDNRIAYRGATMCITG